MRKCDIRSVQFSTCALNQNSLFFYTNGGECFVKMDLNTKKIYFLQEPSCDSTFRIGDFMLTDENKIYTLEIQGKKLVEYTIENNTYKYYNISCNKELWGNFAAFAKHKNTIYIFLRNDNNIVSLDLSSGEIKRDSGLYDNLFLNKASYFAHGCQRGEEMWLLVHNEPVIVVYDMDIEQYQRYQLPDEVGACIYASWFNNELFLLNHEGKLYVWNVDENHIEFIASVCKSLNYQNGFIVDRFVVTNQNIWVLPNLGLDIYLINRNTGDVSIYNNYPEDFQYLGYTTWSKYYGYCEDSMNYFLAMRTTNYLLSINKFTGEENWIRPILPSVSEWLCHSARNCNNIFREPTVSIYDILEYIGNFEENIKDIEK